MTLNPAADGTETQERDIVKLERFIFDAIPFDEHAQFFETERVEEFAPLKNRERPNCMRNSPASITPGAAITL